MSTSIQRETPILCLAYEKIEGKKNQQQQTFSFLCYLLSFASKNKEKKTQSK